MKANYTAQISRILNAVSEHTRISTADILSSSRLAPVVRARHIVMWICRYYTGATQQQIADALHCKRHATVIHGVNSIDNICRFNKPLLNELHTLAQSITK